MMSAKKSLKILYRATWVGSIANILLSLLKIVVGKATGSQALVADGIHSLSDLVTDAAILLGARIWTAPADTGHPYGHARFETLTNIFIGVLLASVGIMIGYDSLLSISQVQNIEPSLIALAAAVVSIITKEILYRWTVIQAKKANSSALFANAWHHRSDALSSMPVAVAIIAQYFLPSLHYLDQIAALIVTIMILKAAVEILTPALRELTDAQADTELEQQIQLMATQEIEIKEIHAIRSRRAGSSILLDFHLLVDPEFSIEHAHDIAEKFKAKLFDHIENLVDVIIHIEPFNLQESRKNRVLDSSETQPINH